MTAPALSSHKTVLLVLSMLLAGGGQAQQAVQEPAGANSEPAKKLTWSLSHETWSLPGNERMGMVGGRVLMDVMPHLQLGVASYGAVRGERGGFITLGGEAQTRWPLGEQRDLVGGLFVGGGGGRDGRALAGGGLMVRTHLGLEQQFGSGHRVGLGVSHVDFPDGRIRSTQPYLSYAYDFDSHLYGGWPDRLNLGRSDRAWLSEQEFAVTGRHYQFARGVTRDDGVTPQHRSMQLLGAQWTGYLSPHWFVTLEAEGALGGQNAGYMQILPGLGYRLPLTAQQMLKLHASLGPAGGGGADTGGGALTDVGVSWQVRVLPRQSLELTLSDVRAPSQSFHATSVGIKWVHHLQRPGGDSPADGLDTERLRMRLVNQTYRGASADWRCCYPDQRVENLGLQLDYMLSPASESRQWFLSGQGLAAYKGQAGAYMTGLVGAGVHQRLSGRWHAEAEALVGAAGGGGLRTGGGLVAQANAGLGYQFTPRLALLASVGRIQAVNDSFKANVLGVSAVYRFSALSVARP